MIEGTPASARPSSPGDAAGITQRRPRTARQRLRSIERRQDVIDQLIRDVRQKLNRLCALGETTAVPTPLQDRVEMNRAAVVDSAAALLPHIRETYSLEAALWKLVPAGLADDETSAAADRLVRESGLLDATQVLEGVAEVVIDACGGIPIEGAGRRALQIVRREGG